MKMALATLVCVLGTYVSADFIWDIPPEEFGKVTGETFVYDLGVPPVPGYLSCPLIPYLKSLGGDRSE